MTEPLKEWKACPDGSLGVFAGEPIAEGTLVELCYSLLLEARSIPGKQLPPWLYPGGSDEEPTFLFPFGWGLLYNEAEGDPNLEWQRSIATDAEGTPREYLRFCARRDIAMGEELFANRGVGLVGRCRDVISSTLRVLTTSSDVEQVLHDAGAQEARQDALEISTCLRDGFDVHVSPLHGLGVFAKLAYASGDAVEIAPALLIDRWELGQCLVDYRFFTPDFRPVNSVVKVALGVGSVFNHSRTPNLGYREASIEGATHAQAQATFYYALRDIAEGEELCISYGDDWWKSRENKELPLWEWRLGRGETKQGRPFYDSLAFAEFCKSERAKDMPITGTSGSMTPAIVETLHRKFVHAAEGDVQALETWWHLCDTIKQRLGIIGGLNAPLRDSGERAAHSFAERGCERNLKWLVQRGADVNAATAPSLDMSPDGDASSFLSPAHVAAICGQLDALCVLVSAGAEINCKRPDGATPVDFAHDQGHTVIVEWLVRHGGKSGLAG